MKYTSFESGLRALASHQTGNEAFFGALEVGLKKESVKQRPYLTLANHLLYLNDEEAASTKQIIIDFERFPETTGKETMRIEFIKHGNDWKIMQLGPVKSSYTKEPIYSHMAELRTLQESVEEASPNSSRADVSFNLGNWRLGKLEIVKDANSIGTVLNSERKYCGTMGIQNVAYLHQPARQ